MIEVLFWILILLIAYIYVGYPLLVHVLDILRNPPPVKKGDVTPTVSFIIAAYNEEKVIEQKIENSLALDYPREKLKIIVASDGSNDRTNEIVRMYQDQSISLVVLETNKGKSAAQNHALAETHSDIILFTDADVMLQPNAVSEIIKNFADKKVGCVIGKINYSNLGDTLVSKGEGIYWRYEQFLRFKESEVGNFAMGSGFMAIRRELFQPLNPQVGEDFVLPMQTVMSGYRVVYELQANSETVLHQTSIKNMFRSKVRVINKDLCGLFQCRVILHPFRHPFYAWGLVSHKLFRWLVPYFLILIFITNLFLMHIAVCQTIFALQIIFYLFSLTGYLWQKKGMPPFIFGIPFSFCLVNLAALAGIARFLMGKKAGQWKTVRS